MLIRSLVVAAAALTPLATHSQGVDALPDLSGRWTFVPTQGGQTLIDSWSVRFEGDRAASQVKGRLSWRGRGCGAQDEPVVASWNGREIRLEFVTRPNVNTQLANATYCGDGKTNLVLRRKPGTMTFDGEAAQPSSGVQIQVIASP